jgi:hypothetical protein
MGFFERDPTRPGNVTLQIGLLAYLLMLVLSIAAVNTGSNIAMAALGGFVSGPVAVLTFALPLGLLLALLLVL